MVQAVRRKYHYIYQTVCSITDKFYIGMHSTDDLNDGYKGSGKILWFSIRKYGIENHHTTILEYLPTREDLRLREHRIINDELLGNPQCMNLAIGGGYGWEYVNKTPKTKEWHAAGGRAANLICSKKHSNRLTTDSQYEQRWRQACSEAQLKRTSAVDYINPNLGNTYSDEVRTKMSELNKGEKNSQFGTCWIYSVELEKAIKIAKNEIQSYLDLGWIKGRKPNKEMSF
jgi:hypothetical protein